MKQKWCITISLSAPKAVMMHVIICTCALRFQAMPADLIFEWEILGYKWQVFEVVDDSHRLNNGLTSFFGVWESFIIMHENLKACIFCLRRFLLQSFQIFSAIRVLLAVHRVTVIENYSHTLRSDFVDHRSNFLGQFFIVALVSISLIQIAELANFILTNR